MKHRSTSTRFGPPVATLLLALAVAVVGSGLAAQDSEPDADNVPQNALIKPLALESLLLDGAASGDRMVAVGERGHILVSDDGGGDWRQAAEVPTRATLTAVYLHDEKVGWAVGHDAVILRTEDGGETWKTVHSAPEEQLPLLDIWFRDADHGVAIGAYGYFLESSDGGVSWSQITLDVTDDNDVAEDIFAYDEGGDYHLNHLARSSSGRLYIAAEAGTIYRSADDGLSWKSLPSPYAGSYFGSLPLGGDSLLVFGLRGHLFRSDDAGETWRELDSKTESMLTDGVRRSDGTIVLVGLAGTVLVSTDGGENFELRAQTDRQAYSAIVDRGDSVVLFGEFGITRLAAAELGAG